MESLPFQQLCSRSRKEALIWLELPIYPWIQLCGKSTRSDMDNNRLDYQEMQVDFLDEADSQGEQSKISSLKNTTEKQEILVNRNGRER